MYHQDSVFTTSFPNGDALDPWQYYIENFINLIEAETKRRYETFLEQAVIPLAKVLQKKCNKMAKFHIFRKNSGDIENNQNAGDHSYYTGLYWGEAHKIVISSTRYPIISSQSFQILAGTLHIFSQESWMQNSKPKTFWSLQKTTKGILDLMSRSTSRW